MALVANKIRLGAPDSMILFGTDLGASQGGAELDYNPTNFLVEVDQAIMPVKVFVTKEEISFTVALVQFQMNLVNISFGLDPVANVATVGGSPNTDTSYFGGTINVKQGAFDWAVPKNDTTGYHIRGHFNICFSMQAVKLDFKREKNTELNKVKLLALADLTQPVGQQAGWLREEY